MRKIISKAVLVNITVLLFSVVSLISGHAAATNHYTAHSITPGATGSITRISGIKLKSGDTCRVITSAGLAVDYVLVDDGATVSSPDILAPEKSPGLHRWHLIKLSSRLDATRISGVLSSENLPTNQPNGGAGLDENGNLPCVLIPRSETAAGLDWIILNNGELSTTTDTLELRRGDGFTYGGIPVGRVGPGIIWTANTSTVPEEDWRYVVYGNGKFVSLSNEPYDYWIMTSEDGHTWSPSTLPASGNSWQGITYGNGLFVAVAYTGTYKVATSPDGANGPCEQPQDQVGGFLFVITTVYLLLLATEQS
jgi:hypothetical protein